MFLSSGRRVRAGRGRDVDGIRSRPKGESDLPETAPSFDDQFTALFDAYFRRIFRVMDRLSGEPDLASDLAQEAFIRLFRRGSMPDSPEAWLISVAMNLLRNEKTTRARRRRLLSLVPREAASGESLPSAVEVAARARSRRVVRDALDKLPEREQRLLVLRAEGFSYRDIAGALELNEASIGVLLARARRAFIDAYEGDTRAS